MGEHQTGFTENKKKEISTQATHTHLQQLGLRLAVQVGGHSLLLLLQGALHPQHVGGGAVLRDPRLHLLRVKGPVFVFVRKCVK